jgi:hypothetical protein
MRRAIPLLSNISSWRGAQIKQQTTFTFADTNWSASLLLIWKAMI